MFVQNLNKEQQIALYKTTEILISCDGEVTSEELEYLDFLKKQMPPIPEAKFEIATLQALLNTKQSKVSFMLELIAIAYADEDYHESEVHLISEIASVIGIDNHLLNKLESWVVKQTTLLSDAEELME